MSELRSLSAQWVMTSIALLGVVTAASSMASPPKEKGYSFVTIDPPSGQDGVDFVTQIAWINDKDVVTVQFQSPLDPNFLANMNTSMLKGKKWTLLDVPNAITIGGTNANEHNVVVLSYQDAGDPVWYAAYSGKHGLTSIPAISGYPGGFIVQGVNDDGKLAANVIDADGVFHGFVGDAGAYTVFDVPDSLLTQPMSINEDGVVVGFYVASDGTYHAFKWKDGEITDIDSQDATDAGIQTAALAINDAGDVAGSFFYPDGTITGYMEKCGSFSEFVVPDSTYTFAYSINKQGKVAGTYGDSLGVPHGFVATPSH